ncbi:GNAT family N-acetyltransferase [soil metagenome]
MTTVVRPVSAEELPAFLEALSTGFLERPDVAKVAEELKPLWDLQRTLAAFDGDRICGTFRSWASELTVPGGARLPASAVTAVTVMPTHRRRGVLRSMMTAEKDAVNARGEAVGVLYASEYPIYGRFGYGSATRSATWTVDALGTGFHAPATGSLEVVTPGQAAVEAMKGVFDAWRLQQTGEISRPGYRWEYDLGLRPTAWGKDWKGFLVLHRDPSGTVDGYVRYRTEEKWEKRQPRNVVLVDELHALSDDAYRSLWRFLVEIDLVSTIKAEWRSSNERLPWLLTNARAAVASDVGEAVWVRLFDVPRALMARTYERAASIVLEVIDPALADGRVNLLLDASPDGTTCAPTDRGADLTVGVAALGAAYLGGSRLRDAVLAGGADEHRAGALSEADALLRTADEPWCSTFF